MIRHSALVRRPAAGPPPPSPRRRAATAAGILVLAATAATGCSSGSATTPGAPASSDEATDAAAPTSTIDPCTLLDRETLGSALGADLTPSGPAFASSRGSACEWTFDAETAPGTLTITAWEGEEFFSTAIGEPVDGIADEARVDPGLGVLLFRQGPHVIQVQVLPTAEAGADEEIARELAAAL